MGEYEDALRLARDKLAKTDPTWISSRGGGSYSYQRMKITIVYMGREAQISFPQGEIYIEEEPADEVDTLLLLHYLVDSIGGVMENVWIAYRDLPGARYHQSSFRADVEEPLARELDGKEENLLAWIEKKKLERENLGDIAFIWKVLPRIPLLIVYNRADEEFPAEARVFFDASASNFLPTEDLEILAERAVRYLVKELEAR